jgi:hypothetical protein
MEADAMDHLSVLTTILGIGAATTLMSFEVLRHLRRRRCAPRQYPLTPFLWKYEKAAMISLLVAFDAAMLLILLGLVAGWLGGMGYIDSASDMDSANDFERNVHILYGLVGYAPVIAIPSACCLLILISFFRRAGNGGVAL